MTKKLDTTFKLHVAQQSIEAEILDAVFLTEIQNINYTYISNHKLINYFFELKSYLLIIFF